MKQAITFIFFVFLTSSLYGSAHAMTLEEVMSLRFDDAGIETAHPDMRTGAGLQTVQGPKRANTVRLRAPAVSVLPVLLDKENTEYILETDVTAPATAFTITASNITLNLNGHTVRYSQQAAGEGITVNKWWAKNVWIINGRIEQGKGAGKGNPDGKGQNPVFTLSCVDLTIAGLDISYHGPDTSGIYIRNSKRVNIHHNVIEDKGSVISNRHQGLAVIRVRGEQFDIHHNIIRRARQLGVSGDKQSNIHHNDITVDSQATNSFGIRIPDGEAHHNRIYGKGEHPIGIWPGDNTVIHTNFVSVRNTSISKEYGSTGAACFRMTWGKNVGVEAYGNMFLVTARKNGISAGKDSWGRALFIGLPEPDQDARIHHNIIIGYSEDGESKSPAVGIVCNNNTHKLVLDNNIIAANRTNILLADHYGFSDGYPVLRNNRFIRIGDIPEYKTIRSKFSTIPSTALFVDNTFESGASPESTDMDNTFKAKQSLAFASRYPVRITNAGSPVADALVTITDAFGAHPFSIRTDANGVAMLEVVHSYYTNLISPDTALSPLRITSAPKQTITVLTENAEYSTKTVLGVRRAFLHSPTELARASHKETAASKEQPEPAPQPETLDISTMLKTGATP